MSQLVDQRQQVLDRQLARRRPASTSGRTILLNSAASMSMWILVAPTQNSDSLPVMRSSQRAPIAMIRSQFDDRLVGVGGAVHAEHALVQRVVLGARRPCRAAC